ncbi:ARM repeat-containing protein [Rickenella mellea]|uniref:ARM repeat-containing protein n=1 Tax=Rickenella mellea TaxID=50990 RepID=A0A4Y7Q3J4_9AGAM|nr:ARM repeat-containing protein [Rickenella mellea]
MSNAAERNKGNQQHSRLINENNDATGTPPNESTTDFKRSGGSKNAVQKVDWVLCISTLVDVQERPAPLDGHTELAQKLPNARGVALSKPTVHIIAAESGAYLAMKAIEFIDWYGTEFEDDVAGFCAAWKSFLVDHRLGSARAEENTLTEENPISPLIRSVILVQPSLPAPSGFNKLMWKWTQPKIYNHLAWPPPTEWDALSAKQKRRRYAIAVYKGPGHRNNSNGCVENETQATLMELPDQSKFNVEVLEIHNISGANVESGLSGWLEHLLREASLSDPVAYLSKQLRALSSPVNEIRDTARSILGSIVEMDNTDDELATAFVHAIPTLILHLSSTESDIHTAALRMLDISVHKPELAAGFKKAIPVFIRVISGNQVVGQIAALKILQWCALPSNAEFAETVAGTLPTIAQLLASPEPEVRDAARTILETSSRTYMSVLSQAVAGIIPSLVHHLSSSDGDARFPAQMLLALFVRVPSPTIRAGIKAVMPTLNSLLSDPNPSIQAACFNILSAAVNENVFVEDVIGVLPVVNRLLSSAEVEIDVEVAALNVLVAYANTLDPHLARVVAAIIQPIFLSRLSAGNRVVRDTAWKALEGCACSRLDELAEVVAATIPTLNQILCSDQNDLHKVTLKILEACARTHNKKLTDAVSTTVPIFSHILSSDTTDLHRDTLKVVEVYSDTNKAKLADGSIDVGATVQPIVMVLLSPRSDWDTQKAALRILGIYVRVTPSNDKLAEAVADAIPELLWNSADNTQLCARVIDLLSDTAIMRNGKLAAGVAANVPTLTTILSSDSSFLRQGGLTLLHRCSQTHNKELAMAVAAIVPTLTKMFSSDDGALREDLRGLLASCAETPDKDLAKAIADILPTLIEMLRSDHPGKQRSALGFMMACEAEVNRTVAQAVAGALPMVVEIYFSVARNDNVRRMAWDTLLALRRSSNALLADATSAAILLPM